MFKTFVSIIILFFASAVEAQQQRADSNVTAKQATGVIHFPIRLALPAVPADYYAKNLSFFCDKELKVEKAIKIPLRIRLGSVEYCDKLEGKNR